MYADVRFWSVGAKVKAFYIIGGALRQAQRTGGGYPELVEDPELHHTLMNQPHTGGGYPELVEGYP